MLGPRAVALGRAATDAFPLRDVALPALRGLRDKTQESVQLYVRDGDRRVCVASLQSPHGLRTIVDEGAALPLRAVRAARCLLERPAVLERGGPNRWASARPVWRR